MYSDNGIVYNNKTETMHSSTFVVKLYLYKVKAELNYSCY